MSAIHASVVGSCAASQFFEFNETVTTTVLNYNLAARAVAAGWDSVTRLKSRVIVSGSGRIGSNNASIAGFDTGICPFGSDILLTINSGLYLVGKGGDGGGASGSSAYKGSPGGPALQARCPMGINNSGVIGGGGGGGNLGYGNGGSPYFITGSGGAGEQVGIANSAGKSPGNPGSIASGGARVYYPNGTQYNGKGGDLGQAGQDSSYYYYPLYETAGAPGAAVIGNSFITWINLGTRLGAIT